MSNKIRIGMFVAILIMTYTLLMICLMSLCTGSTISGYCVVCGVYLPDISDSIKSGEYIICEECQTELN